MHFFPALASSTDPASQAQARFGFMDAKAGPDFFDLLSQHLDRPDTQGGDSCSSDGGPPPESAPAAAQDRAPDAPPADLAGQDSPRAETDDVADQGHRTSRDDARDAGRADEQAKAADRGESAPRDGQRSSGEAADSGSDEPVAVQASGAPVQDSGAQDRQALTEALDAAAQEISHSEPDNSEARDRIAALRELIAELQQAEPSRRRELAVTLGERIRALREEFAPAGGAGEMARAVAAASGKAGHAGVGDVESSQRRRSGRKGAETAAQAQSARNGERPAVSVRGASPENGTAAADKAAQAGGAKPGAPATKDGVAPKSSTEGLAPLVEGEQTSASSSQPGHGVKGAAAGRVEPRTAAVAPGHGVAQAGAEAAAGADALPEGAEGGRNLSDASAAAGREAPSGDAAIRAAEGKPARDVPASAAGKDPASVQAAELAGRTETVRDKGLSTDASVSAATDPRSGAASGAAGSKGGETRQDARQGFFARSDDKALQTKDAAAQAGRNASEGGVQGAGLHAHSTVQQRGDAPVTPRAAEVYRQVETGAFKNLGQGVRQLVIRLDPEDLGQVSVILQVKGKEVQAVLRASNQEASQALGEQLSQLRSQLEAQGLKVGRLEVQTQLADSQSQSQWQGAEQHNRYQENRELALSAQRWRNLDRADQGLVRDVQSGIQREKLSQSGLDIFA